VHPYALRMSKSDRFKEEIAWLKACCGAGGAIDVSLSAWLVRNYETVPPLVTGCAVYIAVLVTIAIVAAIVRLYRCLKLLEDA
jgi:hypothetical protein